MRLALVVRSQTKPSGFSALGQAPAIFMVSWRTGCPQSYLFCLSSLMNEYSRRVFLGLHLLDLVTCFLSDIGWGLYTISLLSGWPLFSFFFLFFSPISLMSPTLFDSSPLSGSFFQVFLLDREKEDDGMCFEPVIIWQNWLWRWELFTTARQYPKKTMDKTWVRRVR